MKNRYKKNKQAHKRSVPINPEIIGTLDLSRTGFGFVTPLEKYGLSSILIPARFLLNALPGDLVKVELLPKRREQKQGMQPKLMGRIKSIVSMGTQELVVQVKQVKDVILAKPIDVRYRLQIQLDLPSAKGQDLRQDKPKGKLFKAESKFAQSAKAESKFAQAARADKIAKVAAQPGIDIPTEAKIGAELGVKASAQVDFEVNVDDFLLVQLGKQLGPAHWSGRVLKHLKQDTQLKTLELIVKTNNHIPMLFASDVQQAARDLPQAWLDSLQALPETISAKSTALRQDLRDLPFVTIDGADARDFDDAIYVQQQGQNWVLWVAIADVSHFVTPNSVLDVEARSRGNSFYFPSSVEPMLPPELSNELCSLKPHEPRLVMAARMEFTASGDFAGSSFFPGVISSAARLTYIEVQEALDSNLASGLNNNPNNNPDSKLANNSDNNPNNNPNSTDNNSAGALGDNSGRIESASNLIQKFPWLRQAEELAKILMAKRDAQGRLDLDLPEADYLVQDDELQGIGLRTRLFSHRLIEEFMLSANEAVAVYLSKTKFPFPYRVHPAPDAEKMTNLKRTLAATAINLPKMKAKDELTPVMLNTILAKAKASPQGYLVGRLVLRSLMQARYSLEAGAHFGLASDCYCHFTSPIRRYADLLVHRALKAALDKGVTIPRAKIKQSVEVCNSQERLAVDAEREMAKRLGCLYLSQHLGEYAGIVSGLNPYGLFVELESLPIEGMVRVESLPVANYDYNPERLELRSTNNKYIYRLGDRLQVVVQNVSQERLEIDLALATIIDEELVE